MRVRANLKIPSAKNKKRKRKIRGMLNLAM
jgi:hypothetical protein